MASQSRTVITNTACSANARLKPVPVGAVRLSDTFWEPRRQTVRRTTLPGQYRLCEESGRVDNFRRAAGKKQCEHQGYFFNDSDIYKWLEAVAWTLATDEDPELKAMADSAIREVADAQQPDGYLNTYFMFERENQRWTNLKDLHELYCIGHLIQAAVAYRRATGEDALLQVARRAVDNACDVFGPEEDGKRIGTCGHEEIEMALVELARETGDAKYLRQAGFFVDARGRGVLGGSVYLQDHVAVRDAADIAGHAVRQMYLTCGVTDVYAETGEPALRAALDRLWTSMTARRMYVTGGLGARHEGEAFGADYELPNDRAYTETCAAIGGLMWAWRMLALEGDASYADALEHILYNAALPGIGLDGESYFYVNPLSNDGSHRRQPWFGCACCPPNIARLLAQLPGYLYSVSDEGAWCHLHAAGSADLVLPGGTPVTLNVQTDYPWDGDLAITVQSAGEFSLFARIPGWCGEGARADVNGEPVPGAVTPGTYLEVRRAWQPGDVLRLRLPMPARLIEAHPHLAEDTGRVAIARGPLVYCVEGVDHPGVDVRDLVLPADPALAPAWRPDLLGGVVTLTGKAQTAPPGPAWEGRLYRETGSAQVPAGAPVTVTAVPYYAWASREPGRMEVWLRRTI